MIVRDGSNYSVRLSVFNNYLRDEGLEGATATGCTYQYSQGRVTAYAVGRAR